MSGRIRDLETALGHSLFDRTSRSVELTQRGADLVPEVVSTLARLAEALEPQPDLRTIRVAATLDVRVHSLLAAIDRVQTSPGPTQLLFGLDLAEALIDDRCDLAVTWSSAEQLGAAGRLSERKLMTVDCYAVVLADDPLAASRSVGPIDLAGRPVVLFDRRLAPGPHDAFVSYVGRGSSSPLVSLSASHGQAGMRAQLVGRSGAFTFASEAVNDEIVRSIPLDPPVEASHWALTRPDDEALLERFVGFVDEF